jgi:hypothetical protein
MSSRANAVDTELPVGVRVYAFVDGKWTWVEDGTTFTPPEARKPAYVPMTDAEIKKCIRDEVDALAYYAEHAAAHGRLAHEFYYHAFSYRNIDGWHSKNYISWPEDKRTDVLSRLPGLILAIANTDQLIELVGGDNAEAATIRLAKLLASIYKTHDEPKAPRYDKMPSVSTAMGNMPITGELLAAVDRMMVPPEFPDDLGQLFLDTFERGILDKRTSDVYPW